MVGGGVQENNWSVCVCFPVFLSLLLVGMALWWWRGQFWPTSPLIEQSFSLKESHDPLIICEPPIGPNACLVKARDVFTRTHTYWDL